MFKQICLLTHHSESCTWANISNPNPSHSLSDLHSWWKELPEIGASSSLLWKPALHVSPLLPGPAVGQIHHWIWCQDKAASSARPSALLWLQHMGVSGDLSPTCSVTPCVWVIIVPAERTRLFQDCNILRQITRKNMKSCLYGLSCWFPDFNFSEPWIGSLTQCWSQK